MTYRIWQFLEATVLVFCPESPRSYMYRHLQLNRGTRRALELVVAITVALVGSYLILRSPW